MAVIVVGACFISINNAVGSAVVTVAATAFDVVVVDVVTSATAAATAAACRYWDKHTKIDNS